MTRNELDDEVKAFQRWIKTQPDLPQNIGLFVLCQNL